MVYRNEVKHLITPADKAALCARLRVVAKPDPHAGDSGQYRIRSLYFDSITDKALREKLYGVSEREKFRLRCYNGDTGLIRLEKKEKRGGLGRKLSEPLTPQEAQRIVQGDTDWMAVSGRPLLIELYSKMKAQGLRPRTIVDYTRTPFVYAPGNVRITIDENLRTRPYIAHLFASPRAMTPVLEPDQVILEVKFDDFLPGHLAAALADIPKVNMAISKFALCMNFI